MVSDQRHGLTAGVNYQTASKAYNNNRETWRSGVSAGSAPYAVLRGRFAETHAERDRLSCFLYIKLAQQSFKARDEIQIVVTLASRPAFRWVFINAYSL